jgi:hypothetical protein
VTKPEIKVEGARELKKALKDVENGIADLKAVHADAAAIVEVKATSLVPRRSGTLGDSIRSSGNKSGGVVRAGRARVPYAGPIHFGWPARNIAPQPFLYDALDDRRSEVIDVYEKRVGDLIKKNKL